MQVVSFGIPRFYDDVSFRLGGLSYDIPFANFKNPKLVPFNQSDFEGVDRRDNTEDLQTFFGIDDNSPLPPTLTMPRTGRGRNLLNAARLNNLDAELEPIFGYPAWLSLSLKDWVKYEMQKENDRWFALNGINEVNALNEELKNFANNFAKNQAFASKVQFLFKMPPEVVKRQLQEPIFFFDTLPDGAEYKKYFQPATYVNPENRNIDVIEVLLPKKYPLDYIKYLNFLAVGDKSIDLTAWNTEKTANDIQIDIYFAAPSHTVLPFSRYPLFDLFPNLTPSSELYNVSIFYEPRDFSLTKPKLSKEDKEEKEPEAEPILEPKKKIIPKENLHWLWLLLLFVVLLIIFQKSSQ